MALKTVTTDTAPQAVGPYSQAVISNGMVYCAGQVGLDKNTGELVEGDVKAQANQALQNLSAVLEAAGSSLEKAVQASCFLITMDDFPAFNEAYAEFFPNHKPARTTVAVAQLPKNAKVEIAIIAETEV